MAKGIEIKIQKKNIWNRGKEGYECSYVVVMVVVVVTVVVLKKSKCREIGQICHKKALEKIKGHEMIIRCSSGCGGGGGGGVVVVVLEVIRMNM